MKCYRLKKSLLIFRHVLRLYKRKQRKLTDPAKKELVQTLRSLQDDLIKKDRKEASAKAHKAETLAKTYLPKSPFEKVRDFVGALAFALIVATLVRTMWFEFYEIPTGSMRPTLQEQDRLVVSKTNFGINIPLYKGHFFFKPDLLQRSSTLIFTGRDMDIADLDTLYFYIFPGKKQFVKRLIGKPGDTLYFYGGQIYGIDAEGYDITDELQPKILKYIDHVPFLSFNGRMSLASSGSIASSVIIKQMNEKVARLALNYQNKPEGELLPPYNKRMNDFFDLWGFKTYGMARMLTKEEAIKLTNAKNLTDDASLFLEIFHHPSVKHPLLLRSQNSRLFPGLGVSQTLLPLSKSHLKNLMSRLYTARFIVKDGKASRFGSPLKPGANCSLCISLPGVPNGTYEFEKGVCYKIHPTGIRSKVASTHPLYDASRENVQTLYNLGIEWRADYSPQHPYGRALPSRYVYFRNGDLCSMNTSFMKKDDPTLIRFIHEEHLKQMQASANSPYFPFEDSPPLFTDEGKIDPLFIKQYGITVPAKHYLVLGDNYAMSADSRDFGFVPEANIRGAPAFIFYPPGSKWGAVKQTAYPVLTSPRVTIWILFLLIMAAYLIYHRKYHKLPVQIDE